MGQFVPGWVITSVFALLITALTALAIVLVRVSERLARVEERQRLTGQLPPRPAEDDSDNDRAPR